MRKLIIYTDGAYENRKAGWSFVYFYNVCATKYTIGYGIAEAENSRQSELLAIIHAINNIEIDEQVDLVEIRCDVQDVVENMNKLCRKKLFFQSLVQLCCKYSQNPLEQYLQLALHINNINSNIKFVKVNNRDTFHKIAHRHAGHALRNLSLDDNRIYYKNENRETAAIQNSEMIQDALSSFEFSEVKHVYSKSKTKHQIVELNLEDIMITEQIHLSTGVLDLNGILLKVYNEKNIIEPIVVRNIEDSKYSLLYGFKRFCAARIVGINKVPAIITELSREEYIKQVEND